MPARPNSSLKVWVLFSLGLHLIVIDLSRRPFVAWMGLDALHARGEPIGVVSIESVVESDAGTDPLSIRPRKITASQKKRSAASTSFMGGLPAAVDEIAVTEMPRLLSEVRVPYPAAAVAAGVQGAVILDLLIDDKGVVRAGKVIEGPGHGLNEAALSAVLQFRFSPAKVEEKFVAVRVRYSYRFVLDR